MIHLHHVLTFIGRSQADLARAVKVSQSTITLICRYDRWPRTIDRHALQRAITDWLRDSGAPAELIGTAFDRRPEPACAPATAPATPEEDPSMLLRKQTLSRDARQHFRVPRDPFTDEMSGESDVFLSDDIRYVRAAMRQTARHGGMLAVISESGGGKSTLRHDLAEWINASGEPITLIEPYVLGMEDSDAKGKVLKAADITGRAIRSIAPGTRLRASTQDRADQLHEVLKASAQVGRRHVLIIEEAHRLAVPTLRHLKGFYELQDGFRKLMSIILIGQTELEHKLSEHNPEIREVVQRCEIVTLPPLDNHVEAYLRHKLARAELSFEALFEPDAVDEIRNRLRMSYTEPVRTGQRQLRQRSLCYPLAINNLVSAAMNEAVRIGAPKVNAQLIAAAARAS